MSYHSATEKKVRSTNTINVLQKNVDDGDLQGFERNICSRITTYYDPNATLPPIINYILNKDNVDISFLRLALTQYGKKQFLSSDLISNVGYAFLTEFQKRIEIYDDNVTFEYEKAKRVLEARQNFDTMYEYIQYAKTLAQSSRPAQRNIRPLYETLASMNISDLTGIDQLLLDSVWSSEIDEGKPRSYVSLYLKNALEYYRRQQNIGMQSLLQALKI